MTKSTKSFLTESRAVHYRLWFGVLGLILLVSRAYSDDAQRPEPRLLAPDKITGIHFGDPVLIPVAIINPSDVEVEVPLLRFHSPSRAFDVQASAGRVDIASVKMGGGDFHLLPPRRMESSVLIVNLWAPELSRNVDDFSKPATYVIDMRLATRTRSFTHRVTVETSGSSFNEKGHEALRQAVSTAPRNDDADMFYTSNVMMFGHASPFWPGATPLSWLDWDSKKGEQWYDSSSELVTRADSFLRQDSRASRMLRASVALAEMKGAARGNDPPNVAIALNEYAEVIEASDCVTQQFLAFAAKNVYRFQHAPVGIEGVDADPREAISFLADQLPHLAPQLHSPHFSCVSEIR